MLARSLFLLPCAAAALIAAESPNLQDVRSVPPAPSTANPLLVPAVEQPEPARPRRNRVISPEVAAQLAAKAPKFSPPEPKPEPKPEEELTDLREVDKPKNTIIRLPKFIVRDKPPPILSDKTVSTDKGLAAVAMRRYMSETARALNRFTIPIIGMSAEEQALMMYAEDERLQNMADLNDSARMISAGDKAAGAYVKREADKAYIRPGNFDWRPMGR